MIHDNSFLSGNQEGINGIVFGRTWGCSVLGEGIENILMADSLIWVAWWMPLDQVNPKILGLRSQRSSSLAALLKVIRHVAKLH